MDRRFLFALLGALLLCGLANCEEEIGSLTDDIATDDAPLEVDEGELADLSNIAEPYTCYHYTDADTAKMGSWSAATERRYCEESLGYKFSYGNDNLAPGCGSCWCCRPFRGNRFGIKSSPGVSYEVIIKRMTWSEAERVCNKRHGHLATITSTVMNGELVARLHKEGVDSAWMGYNDIKRDGSWQWVNPSSACQKFTFWNDGEPNGRTNENCGQLYSGSGGHWNDFHCNNKLGFVCEYGATPAKICSHNGDRFTLGGMSYQVVPKKMTWGQAQNNCKELGGHLATITSPTYNAQLVAQLQKRKVDFAWIGYNDKKHDGIWVWVNPASRCEKFTNWNPGEPNGHRGENCARLYSGSGGSSGRWIDLNCDYRLGSLCEIGSRPVKRCQITPPPGMRFKVGGILYGIVSNHLTWNEAENNCKRYGGHLATITSAKQNAQIVANLHSRNVDSAWMGYNDIKADGSWKWANPSSSCKKFTFWNHGEPNGGTNENCGQLYRYNGGRWNDLHCDNKLASVCEYGSAASKICRATEASTQYVLVTKKADWASAEISCKSMGGHLATINSLIQHNYLLKIMKEKKLGKAWIGLSDIKKEGDWKWVNGESKFRKWGNYGSEPNGDTYENCVCLRTYDNGWADYNCDKPEAYFCEVESE